MRTPIDLIVAKYIHEMEAERARADLKAFDAQIIDLATIVKDQDGNLTVNDRDDLDKIEGKNMGALVGGLIGLAFGPAGLIGAAIGIGTGIAAGSITGRFVASQVDTGISDNVLRKMTHDLAPTSSAILIVCEENVGDQIMETLGAHKADVQRYDLNLTFEAKSVDV